MISCNNCKAIMGNPAILNYKVIICNNCRGIIGNPAILNYKVIMGNPAIILL